MLCFPMDFEDLNMDGLIDSGALSGAIPEADFTKNRLLAPHTLLKKALYLSSSLWLPMDS